MHLSPIIGCSLPPETSFDVLEKKSVRQVLHVAKILSKWEEKAKHHETTSDLNLKLNLVCLSNLASFIYSPIDIAKELLISETTLDRDDFTFALKQVFSIEEPALLVSRTKKRKIVAIALHDKKTNELLYLLTNPKNLIYRGTPKASPGAGSSIIHYLALKTLSLEIPLTVKSAPHAREFYKKHHFEAFDARPSSFPLFRGISSLCHMRLTAETISQKLKTSQLGSGLPIGIFS